MREADLITLENKKIYQKRIKYFERKYMAKKE